MRSKQDYMYEKKEKSKSYGAYLFFGIAAFLFIYFPFFGINLRYAVGYQIDYFLNMAGVIIMTLGGICTLFGFLGIFAHFRGWVKLLLLGGLMLWLGCWMTGAPLDFLPGLGGDMGSGSGYH